MAPITKNGAVQKHSEELFLGIGRDAINAGEEHLENIGAGKGFLSRVAAVKCNLSHEQLDKIVVKSTQAQPLQVLASQVKAETLASMHNTEVNVYNLLEQHTSVGQKIPHPKIYAMEKMDLSTTPPTQGFIVMELLQDCQHISVFNNLSPDDLIEPLRAAARLHALAFELTSSERASIRCDLITSWFTELFAKDMLISCFSPCTANRQLLEETCGLQNMLLFLNGLERVAAAGFLSEAAMEAIPLLHRVMCSEYLAKLNNLCVELDMAEVLCHGDLWPPNLLFQADEKGRLKFRALIDYQTANIGCAAMDICRLLATGLSGKDRRESGENVLMIYYDALVKACKPRSPPFGFDQLIQSYRYFLPFAAAVFCLPTSLRFLIRVDEFSDDDDRTEFIHLASEKYSSLLEDAAACWRQTHGEF